MSVIVVGIGDCRVSNNPEDVLVTYALGSCVAVIIHDPTLGLGGLLHFMLPDSGMDTAKAERNPYMFADTGVPLLFRSAYQLGSDKKSLQVTIAGGAQILDAPGTFNIGKRNYLALRKIFWKAGVLVHAEHVGGIVSRTVRLEVKSGKVMLREAGPVEEDLPLAAAGAGTKRGF
ncbi:MAG TPA: chemotaxis protein CheD [Bryobacteraceae bacterium]|jgi:chemotaxis protein CheD|nr:chemotaxis protein CheD [Bryobacteraceae bacterium]